MSINKFIPSIVILSFLGVFIYYIDSSPIAISTTPSSSSLSFSNISSAIATTKSSINSSNTKSIPINSTILYESKEGDIISQRVVNVIGNPQIESSAIEHGLLSGVGNVTRIHTWLNTYRTPNIMYGEGKGVIVSENGQTMAPWIGYGSCQMQNNGTGFCKDIILFSDNATGNMKYLSNVVGLGIATIDGKNQTTKIWKWQ